MYQMLATPEGSAMPPVLPNPDPVPDWLQIAVACASLLGSIGVIVAVATFWFQWSKSKQERIDRKAELAALQRAEDDRIAAQARKIVPEIANSALFGEDIWLAHVQNASTGAVSQLKVVVEARDSDGNVVEDGIAKATGELDIGGGLQKIISDALSGGLGGVMGSNPILGLIQQQQQFGGGMFVGQGSSYQEQHKQLVAQQVGPEVSKRMRQAMMGQLQKNWPPSLGPGAETSVAYRATRPGLQMNIGVGFEDEAGYLWFRINTDQPKRVTPEEFGAIRHAEMQ
ncbi:hypothetical protein [Mycobacteroides abscessus]|uniref:hypothetical protein n=1 Tax=Mycobacteroides abscessus TaxID=36809 RepID=UPI0019D2B78A|nr:hypothetical protein [Mycobacteroides abscessus]MBN7560483.1 hypothetical protein [Mycobacteroides abscessus subsp. abscessus]